MLGAPLSDDEIHEHVIRAADQLFLFALAIEGVAQFVAAACTALTELSSSMERLVEGITDGLTVEQEDRYQAMLSCGVLPLDARCAVDNDETMLLALQEAAEEEALC